MYRELQNAKERLLAGELTLVMIAKGRMLESRERGIKPLLSLLDSGEIAAGAVAADKVVGKAAAFLYVLLGVSALHACVISRPAAEVLHTHGITLTHDTLVEGIRNRKGDGPCPMESAVLALDDPQAALTAIRTTLAKIVK